ncbi:hypothetical protein [Sporosalibacterium faouarense]|uniref:hypothetical protein n=1 Tax=Sporosalibacterium faouarense TaxID=516123 RepID=UPI00141D733B|nr:hypothetical protein [Sporosalibacterium faouarense]MTI47307.1 hypothetical protein [Bacillota bacterium]
MWTAIHMIEGIEAANDIKDKLTQEGFLVKVQLFSKEGDNTIYEILVPEFEASDAHSVLIDIGY